MPGTVTAPPATASAMTSVGAALAALQDLGDDGAPPAPCGHLDDEAEPDEQGQPSAVGDLGDVGGEEGQIDQEQGHDDGQRLRGLQSHRSRTTR